MCNNTFKFWFHVLDGSVLVPFIERKLEVDSFLEIVSHAKVYNCIFAIIREISETFFSFLSILYLYSFHQARILAASSVCNRFIWNCCTWLTSGICVCFIIWSRTVMTSRIFGCYFNPSLLITLCSTKTSRLDHVSLIPDYQCNSLYLRICLAVLQYCKFYLQLREIISYLFWALYVNRSDPSSHISSHLRHKPEIW